jgi:hypothetical protein
LLSVPIMFLQIFVQLGQLRISAIYNSHIIVVMHIIQSTATSPARTIHYRAHISASSHGSPASNNGNDVSF